MGYLNHVMRCSFPTIIHHPPDRLVAQDRWTLAGRQIDDAIFSPSQGLVKQGDDLAALLVDLAISIVIQPVARRCIGGGSQARWPLPQVRRRSARGLIVVYI